MAVWGPSLKDCAPYTFRQKRTVQHEEAVGNSKMTELQSLPVFQQGGLSSSTHGAWRGLTAPGWQAASHLGEALCSPRGVQSSACKFARALKICSADTGIFCSTACKMRGLLRLSQQALTASRAYSSSSTPERKVAILGAAGGIGQPLALLMKVHLCRLLTAYLVLFLLHPFWYEWHPDPFALGQ